MNKEIGMYTTDEPLEKEISVEEMQKIVDRNQSLLKELVK